MEASNRKDVIELTDAAVNRINELVRERDKPCLGIRIGVKSGGCSGLAYTFEYADEKMTTDEVVESKGVKVFINFKAVIYLIGTKLDYIDEEVKSGFVFINPNAKSHCGCGESFSA